MIKQIQSKLNEALLDFKIKRLNKELKSIAIEFVQNNKAIKKAISLKTRQKELKIKFVELKREIAKLDKSFIDNFIESDMSI
jgi:hypothetical protein